MAISDSSVEFECPSFPSEYQPSAIEPNLRWYCQDAVLFPQPEGRLEELLQAYKEAPARQRQASLAVWFSETCLGIARALNNAHEIILDSPAEAIKSAAEFKWRRVGYGNLGTREVMFFDTSKSSEALFPTFYNITSFGLRDNDLTKSAARCRTEFLHRAITEYSYAPEFRVCSEVSLSSDIWALGVLFLHLTAWYLRGFSSVVAGKTFEIVEDSVGGQPGAKISSRIAGGITRLFEHHHRSDYIIDLLELIQSRLLRVNPGDRANGREIVNELERMHSLCLEKPSYCTGVSGESSVRPRPDLSTFYDSGTVRPADASKG